MQSRGLSVLLLFGACYRAPTTAEPCAITCLDECPGDLTCEGGFCVEPGQTCRPSFRAVSAGTGFACGIDDAGALWCWGSNAHKQISPGNRLQYPLATRIDVRSWDSIDAGGEHVCGISGGELFCWGNNDHGQVLATVAGDVDAPLAIQIPGVTTWSAVSVGFAYTCAIGDQQLYCWGANDRGQLGIGSSGVDVGSPTAVMSTVADWTAVAAGRDHTCAISQSLGVHCWGRDDNGGIGPKGPGGGQSQLTPIDVPLPGNVPLLATAIAVANQTSCAATTAGELYCWGDNRRGALGDPTLVPTTISETRDPTKGSNLPGWTALDGSEQMLCGLAGGAIYCWGAANRGGIGGGVWVDARTFTKVLPAASQLSLGWSYERDAVTGQETGALDLGCALVDTEIRCWGDNRYGQLARGQATMELAPVEVAGDHRFSALAVGVEHACGIEGDSLYCWGSTVNGQATGLLSGTSSPRSPCVATLDCDVGIPKPILFANNPDGVATGLAHTCALHDQVMTCWGDNSSFQLGGGGSSPPRRDVPGPTGRAWQSMLPGGLRGQCAAPAPGETWCWGIVLMQQPMRVREPQLDGVRAVASGSDFTCILDRDGKLACLGANMNGQFGNGVADATSCTPPNGICDLGETAATCAVDCCPGGICGTPALTALPRTYQALAASPNGRTACGLLPAPGGQIECWGDNARGQTGEIGTTTTPIASVVPGLAACTAISLATDHSCAICDERIHCWGDNRFGGLGTGAPSATGTAIPTMIELTYDEDPWSELGSGAGFTCARSASGRVACWGVAPHAGLGTGGMSASLPVTVLASPSQ